MEQKYPFNMNPKIIQQISDYPAITFDDIINYKKDEVDIVSLHLILRKLRELASSERFQEFYLETIIQAKYIPFLLNLLEQNISHEMQLDVAWILSNIASCETVYTEELVKYGCIELFVDILVNNENQKIKEQVIWGLSNFIAESNKYRDLLIESRFADKLLEAANQITDHNIVVWCCYNLTKGLPLPNFEKLFQIIPFLLNHLQNSGHNSSSQSIQDALWTLCSISQNHQSQILEYSAHKIIIRFLTYPSDEIVTPALRIIGNIASGSDEQTDKLLKANVHFKMMSILKSKIDQVSMKQETLWLISNICAGTSKQVAAILAVPGLIELVFKSLNSKYHQIVIESAFVLCNAAINSSFQDLRKLLEKGLILQLVTILKKCTKTVAIQVALEGLEAIFARKNKKLIPSIYKRKNSLCKQELFGVVSQYENYFDETISNLSRNVMELIMN